MFFFCNNYLQKAAPLEFGTGKKYGLFKHQKQKTLFILKCRTLVHRGIATKLLLPFVIYETVRHFYINNGPDNSRSINTMIHHFFFPLPRPVLYKWLHQAGPTFIKADGSLCVSLITVITAAMQPMELWTSDIPARLHVCA